MTTWRQVVVESGHMIDTPDRPAPRFPPEAEGRVAAAIARVLDQWQVGPASLVLSQGARGTDILVAEAARARGAEVRLLLALPPPEFEEESVRLERSRWTERFGALVGQCPVLVQPEVLGPLPEGENPFTRNNQWVLDEAFAIAQREGASVDALVVWDGEGGDGKGGTADFVAEAKERGAHVHVLEPATAWRTPNVPYWERQSSPGPKRLLALDGGGIRGVISLRVLARMESLLGGGRDSFVLADYFDYIAGTSTGAIVAGLLARGQRVADIERLYHELGATIFSKRFLPARIRSLYKDGPITEHLQAFFGEHTRIGADELRCLLLLVTHRVDTDSIWPLSNNTKARYNDRSRPDCNLNLLLWEVVRGSTAAPVFFLPEEIRLGEKPWTFEDGGVTPFNNPALLLFEMATSPRYRLGWPTGPGNLLLVSVGTGLAPVVHENLKGRRTNLLFQGKNLIRVIMNGSSTENDRLCRVLGDCRHGLPIDSEFDAEDADTTVAHPLFSYVRYNADISRAGLARAGLGGIDAKRVARLDAIAALDDLVAIGDRAAGQVDLAHFSGFEP